jgi:translation initiation factor 1
MSKPKNRLNIVYSTNPDFQYETLSQDEVETLIPKDQKLYVELDRKGRAGKQVTLISGFHGKQQDLESLSKKLKNICGAGGGTDGGNILVQGDHREKIIGFLINIGYQVKKRGG